MRVRGALAVCLVLVLAACADVGVNADSDPAPMETSQIRIGSDVITVEVARSPEERAMGLMGRSEIADDAGMLFVFEEPRRASFWMRGMLIPIDMVFLRDREVISVIADVPPCSEDPCPTYGPDVPVDAVLELAAGRAATLGVTPGLTISISEK
jgi:uncharacterized protein